jgi:Asp-tRNA(Asn)/Glu-tRNA(Gln) amidotransferase A subunit family amidase
MLASLEDPIDGLRLKWVGDNGMALPERAVLAAAQKAAEMLVELGATLDTSSASLGADRWVDDFYLMMGADRYASIGKSVYEDSRTRAMLSDYALDHFERGARITGWEYSKALEARFAARRHLESVFGDADLLVTPTVGITAPTMDGVIDRFPLVAFTFLVNYVGYTAATIPCGLVADLPVGLQIIGRPEHESTVLRVCRAVERLIAPIRPPSSGGTEPKQPVGDVGDALL